MKELLTNIIYYYFYIIIKFIFPVKYENTNNILIIKLQHIGDCLVSTPAIRALKKIRPDHKITILIEKYSLDVFKDNPYIDEIIIYNGKENIFKQLMLLIKLRKGKFDITLSFINEVSYRFGFLAYITGAKERIGFNINNRGIWYSKKVKFNNNEHRIKLNLKIIKVIEKIEENTKIDIFTDKETKIKVERIIKSIKKYIVIHPGTKWRSKMWKINNWRSLIVKLNELNYKCIIIGTEIDLINRICEDIDCMNFSGKTTLLEASEIIKKAELFIGLDSGPMHIASANSIDSVIITSAQDILNIWTPLNNNCSVIRKNVSCSPCFSSNCSIDNFCMNLITVDEVFNICKEKLKK